MKMCSSNRPLAILSCLLAVMGLYALFWSLYYEALDTASRVREALEEWQRKDLPGTVAWQARMFLARLSWLGPFRPLPPEDPLTACGVMVFGSCRNFLLTTTNPGRLLSCLEEKMKKAEEDTVAFQGILFSSLSLIFCVVTLGVLVLLRCTARRGGSAWEDSQDTSEEEKIETDCHDLSSDEYEDCQEAPSSHPAGDSQECAEDVACDGPGNTDYSHDLSSEVFKDCTEDITVLHPESYQENVVVTDDSVLAPVSVYPEDFYAKKKKKAKRAKDVVKGDCVQNGNKEEKMPYHGEEKKYALHEQNEKQEEEKQNEKQEEEKQNEKQEEEKQNEKQEEEKQNEKQEEEKQNEKQEEEKQDEEQKAEKKQKAKEAMKKQKAKEAEKKQKAKREKYIVKADCVQDVNKEGKRPSRDAEKENTLNEQNDKQEEEKKQNKGMKWSDVVVKGQNNGAETCPKSSSGGSQRPGTAQLPKRRHVRGQAKAASTDATREAMRDQWREAKVQVLLRVPPKRRGHVIGQHGETVRLLRRTYPDVTVTVPLPSDPASCHVALEGPKGQVAAAAEYITARLKVVEDNQPVTAALEVEPALRGVVVGPGGERLLRLAKEHPRVRVTVPPPSNANARTVKLRGPPGEVAAVKASLEATLQEERRRRETRAARKSTVRRAQRRR